MPVALELVGIRALAANHSFDVVEAAAPKHGGLLSARPMSAAVGGSGAASAGGSAVQSFITPGRLTRAASKTRGGRVAKQIANVGQSPPPKVLSGGSPPDDASPLGVDRTN